MAWPSSRSTKPVNTAAKQRGRQFPPGESGNPAGKPRGARHRVTRAIEELLHGEHEALTRKAIGKALEGDMVALRLCLDRLAPPRKDAPITVALPPVKSAQDAVAASTALLEALSAGDVTPDEAGRVMALLTAHKAILEAGDFEARLAALEAKR